MPKKPVKKKTEKRIAPTLRLYRRLSVTFVVLVAIVLGIVIYISTTQATIRIKPIEEKVSTEFILDIVKTPTHDNEIRGRVVSTTLGQKAEFEPSGEGAEKTEGIATGVMTIVNETNIDQALVKTTRLLTSDQVLFRIDEYVNVPAKGKAQVTAHADEPGAAGDIAPTKLTIPGLPTDLQKVIYAENSESFTGGVSTKAVVSQVDIDKSMATLQQKITAEAEEALKTEVGELFDGEAFYATVVSEESTVEPGAEAAIYEVSQTLQVVGVFFDQEALGEVALLKLYEQLEKGTSFSDINTGGLEATVEKFNAEDEKANMRVKLEGTAIASTTSAALDPSSFIGLSEKEVKDKLIKGNLAKEVEVIFFPFWVKKVPQLRDHIYIEIL
ncbi:baseplate J/gp47 family protein [Patescibacteria group bacterium]